MAIDASQAGGPDAAAENIAAVSVIRRKRWPWITDVVIALLVLAAISVVLYRNANQAGAHKPAPTPDVSAAQALKAGCVVLGPADTQTEALTGFLVDFQTSALTGDPTCQIVAMNGEIFQSWGSRIYPEFAIPGTIRVIACGPHGTMGDTNFYAYIGSRLYSGSVALSAPDRDTGYTVLRPPFFFPATDTPADNTTCP